MQAQATLPKLSVETIVERILAFRQITRIDQRLLMAALLSKDSFNENEHSQINVMFDRLQRGLIRIVD
ncbi:hypothetical protein [Kamptonema formosum]|uniref:hypothetical protein n=1 Tax=Kamptonema formosum TaxID=331992 RepID=UPI000345474D|nr:hypothetical protein [Oscillatoria sp. PCC 10802]